MPTIETIKAIKDYGITAVLVIALIWMNGKLTEMDGKLNNIQNRLFDCFEQRIKDNSRNYIFGSEQKEQIKTSKIYAIIPEEIKIKKA